MDKNVIKALSNFGEAIDTLVEELKKQSEDKKEKKNIFSQVFGKKSLNKQLKSIEDGIKDIKKDTKEIIKNQKDMKKLMESDKKDEKSVFGSAGDEKNKNKIKEGVGSIILIAGAVMAIGAAFSILDPKKFDIPLILALSFAITMLGITLAKLKEAGVPSVGESFEIGLAMAVFTGSVVLSAFMIAEIPKVDTNQFLTFLGVAATFALLFEFGMDSMVKATRKIKPKQILYLPLILVGISAAIVGASFVLQYTQPIDFNTLKSVFLTGVTLGALALVMSIPLLIISKLGGSMLSGAIYGVIILPLISAAIMISSHLISMGDYSVILPINWAVSFGISMMFLAGPVALLGLITLPVVAMGAAGLVLIAGAIVLSSWLLSLVKPGFFMDVADGIAYFIDVVGKAIIRFAKQVVPIIIDIVGALVDKIMPHMIDFFDTIIPKMGDFLEKVLNSIFPYIREIFDVAKTFITEIDDILLAIGTIIEKVGGVFPKIGTMFEKIGNAIATPLGAIRDIINAVGNAIMNVINTTVGAVEKLSNMSPEKLISVANALELVGKAMSSVMGGGGFFSKAADIVGSVVGAENPVITLLKTLEDYDGDNLESMGKGLVFIAKGMNDLKSINIEDGGLDPIINVLEKIDKIKSGRIEAVSREVIDSGNLIQELKEISGAKDNEDILNELRTMNGNLRLLLNSNTDISKELRNLKEDNEPKLEY